MPRLDLSQPEDNLKAFIKTRGSLAPEDVVFWFAGSVHSYTPGLENQPGDRSIHLFKFEGFNIGRAVAVEGGWSWRSKEAVFYCDPKSGDILESWTNPMTNEQVKVFHVLNDPVNGSYVVDTPYGKWNLPVTGLDGDDDLTFNIDIFLKYPSPLKRAEYPKQSQNDEYYASEMFQFYTKRSALEDDSDSAPALCSWTRLSPWLPWMEMGDRPGMLVYHCRGKKLADGYIGLPDHIKTYVEAHHPEYTTAPADDSGPNETSWTYYKKQVEQAS